MPVKSSFLHLLRRNDNYRNLWLAQFINSIGDWANNLAALALVVNLTGSGFKAGLVLLAGNLAAILAGPLGGKIVDRSNPKHVLIYSNILGAVLSLGYLFINSEKEIWLMYILGGLLTCNIVVFRVAFGPSVAQVATRNDLLIANSLISISSGFVMAVGAFIGGIFSEVMGIKAPFIFNSMSFILSAIFISPIILSKRGSDSVEKKIPTTHKNTTLSLVKYFQQAPVELTTVFIRVGWAVGGGVVVVIVLFATQVLNSGDMGAGILFGARGLGIIVSVFVIGYLDLSTPKNMRKWVGNGFVILGIGYILFSMTNSLLSAALTLIIAHLGAGLLWPLSDTLKQTLISKQFLGRAYGIEQTGVKIVLSMSIVLAGLLSDLTSPRWVAGASGISYVLVSLLWFSTLRLKGHNNVIIAVADKTA